MPKKNLLLFIAVVLLAPIAVLHAAELKLASLFTDHAVLQRDRLIPVWGWANPGEQVAVTFAGQKKSATADSDGKWMVKLDPLPASAEPRELVVEAGAAKLTCTDVLVGDVWVCSGQSNMSLSVAGALNPQEEIANAQFPEIRLFTVPQAPSLAPVADVKSHWNVCSPQSIAGFSAVAYFFGWELHRFLNIPIGLLHSSVGATAAEAWMRRDVIGSVPALAERADKEIAQIQSQDEDNKKFIPNRAAWEKKNGVEPPPVSESARGWADPALDTSDWTAVKLPASWAQLGAKSGGVFWVRKDINVPEGMAGQPVRLDLNWVNEQYDTAFLNGVEVGRANDKPPEFYNIQRGYRVPGNLVKAGRNVLAVRIVSAVPNAGMFISTNPLGLPITDPGAHDPNWLMKTESTFPPVSAEEIKVRPKPNTLPFRSVSTGLYNGMIAPLIPYAIKGVIWYQGESNTPRPTEYREVLSLLIRDWRAQWGQGEFPFLIQQLVNNGTPMTDPNAPGTWPLVREAQDQVANSLPNCGLATGLELGSAFTIHPLNKQDVGKRLAFVAMEKVYGKKIESSGPRYDAMKIDGAAIQVTFTHAQGLFAKDGPPQNFAIAGADRKFVWADAKIVGQSVVVSSPKVPQPVAVRYAWANNPPELCNLFNAAGLPMAPFRTDDWK